MRNIFSVVNIGFKVETSVHKNLKGEKKGRPWSEFLIAIEGYNWDVQLLFFFHEREIMGAWSSISLQRNLKFMLVDTTRRVAIWSRYWIILIGVVPQKIQANDGRWTLDVVLSIHDLVLTSVYRRDLFIFAAAVPHWPLSVNSRLAPLNILTVSIDPSVDIRRHPSSSSRHFFLLCLVEVVLANRLRRSLASWALGDQ